MEEGQEKYQASSRIKLRWNDGMGEKPGGAEAARGR